MNRKQIRKWKKQEMDTLAFAEYMEKIGDELISKGLFKNPKIRHQYLIGRTPFNNINEVRDWYAFCGEELTRQLVASRYGTPDERYYYMGASVKEWRKGEIAHVERIK